ncbi:MAG: FAD-linked oxidase [Crocinitomicaceae bacterium]|nr:FAD-linked oxidase [Crocinitomicaceae bacterium]|tara:strand:- start:43739 stop:45067 length:1329 start_codon:yes stop_codon:yes gene_type:complete
MKIANWSNYPIVDSQISSYTDSGKLPFSEAFITRGNGRCYGDSSLNNQIASMLSYNKALEFDIQNGVFTCQAGMTLDRVLEIIVPNGWFLPVTPGTKFISVGGAVASNVHGKNHHYDGCFNDHVVSLDLLTASGEIVTCSSEENVELFETTSGGMGLTGMILQVTFRLKKIESSFIDQRSIKAKNLDELVDLFRENENATYSVSWIDCLQTGKSKGRGLILLGEHARIDQLNTKQGKNPLKLHQASKVTFPLNAPPNSTNKITVKAFNTAYYGKQLSKEQHSIIHYDPFFYPLDAILKWNRIYGKKGFLQYQFVIPFGQSNEGMQRVLDKIREYGHASPLVVLKLFGKQDDFISFPMEGFTLALDFPIRRGLFEFLDALDKMILDLGGRHYLTKDARMAKETFFKGYPNAEEFVRRIKKYNPNYLFSSLQSERLGLTQKTQE